MSPRRREQPASRRASNDRSRRVGGGDAARVRQRDRLAAALSCIGGGCRRRRRRRHRGLPERGGRAVPAGPALGCGGGEHHRPRCSSRPGPARRASGTCSSSDRRASSCTCGRSRSSDDGVPLGAAVFMHDISEIHRVDSVRRDFVANVSHELKTPIGALELLAETLASETEAGGHPAVGRADGEGGRAARAHRRRSAGSQHDRDPGVPDAGARARDTLVDEAIDRMRPAARRAAIELQSSDATADVLRSSATVARS